MKRTIDFNLLAAFLAIYDARSVSAAATELDMTQPGVSTALKRLRHEFGDPLFIRTATGMSPTVRARELEEPIRSIIGLVDRKLLTRTTFDPATAEHEFRLAMPDVGETYLLPAIMTTVAREAPRVKLRSLSSRFNEIERAMEAGELDLALGHFPDLKSGNIMETVISRTAFGCLVRAGHPLANKQISLEEFCEGGHVRVEPVERSQELLENHLKANGIRRRVVLTTSHFLCVPQILAATDLMALLPTVPGGHRAPWHGAPVFLPFELPTIELKMYWHRLVHSNPSHQWLRQAISRSLKGLAATNVAPKG